MTSAAGHRPAYMIDQSHNVTDPIESLMRSAEEIRRAYAQALLVDRAALSGFQDDNDALMASETLKEAFRTDVGPASGPGAGRSRRCHRAHRGLSGKPLSGVGRRDAPRQARGPAAASYETRSPHARHCEELRDDGDARYRRILGIDISI